MLRAICAVLALWAFAGCVPLAVGAGGVMIADQIAEDRQGDDGLF